MRTLMGASPPPARKPLDPFAYGLMIALCACWGLQQVAIKVAAAGIPPLLQGAVRSIIATLLLVAWIRARRIPMFDRDGTLPGGIVAGLLFAAEFMFIYFGLSLTTASRMVVFIYLAPVLTALGVHWLVPGEHLKPGQWAGVALAFAGIVVAFGETFVSPGAGGTWLGDACGLVAAFLWAATTLVIRTTKLSNATAEKTLLYQLGISALMLPVASWLAGERGVTQVTPLIVVSMIYQSVIVAFASYLAWFWLLTRYLAGRLAVFSFMTPLFGVLFGVVLLSEPVSAVFIVAAAMVGAGISLVNRR